ncbi:MAG TPA: sulfotransferase [Bacteroidales bacterium]|nr:sulfotransferase [Bacteroidales bacterium]
MADEQKVVSPRDFMKMPFWFKGLNRAWQASYPLGTRIRLDKDSLIKDARKSSGLDDLGKDFWDEPLDRMLWSINNEANLHPIGIFISKERIVNLLANRIRAEYYFKKYPEILDQEVYPVWMIAGLQRTGTTKLQRLLNADPDNRVLASWEAINPAPFQGDEHGNKKRIAKARLSEKALKFMAPGFFAIHPVEHLAPEEDILLLDIAFMSTTAEATMHGPAYASWLEKTDQTYAYQYAAKLMKLLQWQKPAKRWILKSPHHLEFLHLADKVFDQVDFIWTHRDPVVSIPSFLSMMSHSWALFSNDVSLEKVAEHWVRKSTFILNKGIEFRATGGKKFIDIHYEELVGDAGNALSNIYGADGGIDAGLMERFMNAERENPPRKYGVHQYSLEAFGLSKEDIESRIRPYREFMAGNNTKKPHPPRPLSPESKEEPWE